MCAYVQTKYFGHVRKMVSGKLSLRVKTVVLPPNYSWIFAHLGWLFQIISLWNWCAYFCFEVGNPTTFITSGRSMNTGASGGGAGGLSPPLRRQWGCFFRRSDVIMESGSIAMRNKFLWSEVYCAHAHSMQIRKRQVPTSRPFLALQTSVWN